ncbi:MAG: hypothetical protein LC775_02515, partial [Acidobacteria bacterium]|nr:hypothetical protein [Acidobacteriota bacterium]
MDEKEIQVGHNDPRLLSFVSSVSTYTGYDPNSNTLESFFNSPDMQAMSHPALYHPNLIFPVDNLSNALYKQRTENHRTSFASSGSLL